jgi:ATP-dependent Zn protease
MCDKVSLDPKLSLSKVLAITSGFTGADLVNEADIVAHHEMGLVLMALALPNGDTSARAATPSSPLPRAPIR